MLVTNYTITSPKIAQPHTLVMLSDVHNARFEPILEPVAALHPELILVVGDVVDRHRKTYERSLSFLTACVRTAPTVFSYGNHECKFPVLSRDDLEGTGALILDNTWVRRGDLCIGGQTPYAPDGWLDDMEQESGFRILLCHNPEYYETRGLKDRNLDLILSGHAHGGQIRVGSHGVFAPGQGLFPKYVHGIYGNMIVGAGVSNTARPIPRINNPEEVVCLHLLPGPVRKLTEQTEQTEQPK